YSLIAALGSPRYQWDDPRPVRACQLWGATFSTCSKYEAASRYLLAFNAYWPDFTKRSSAEGSETPDDGVKRDDSAPGLVLKNSPEFQISVGSKYLSLTVTYACPYFALIFVIASLS